jgi:hypothetical protein
MTQPNNITVTEVPDADLKEFLDEVAEEDKFEVVSLIKNNATWTVKLKRKVPVPAANGT